jgi:hypothetical protein
MTQHLLELSARQGDSNAIAALMNHVLQPQGVTVEAQIIDRQLQLIFSSSRLLNQHTLVRFTRRGLERLGVTSIRAVTVTGKKIGEESECVNDHETV